MDKNTLLKMNLQSEKYGSSGWIQNVNKLETGESDETKYKLYPTTHSTISGGREYVALPVKLKITWQEKQKYNLI
jgi:hypothetical protein